MAKVAESQERESQTAPSPAAIEERPRTSRTGSPAFKWLLILLVLGLAAVGFWYWGYAAARESTDDAQIDGHVHPVAARVGGAVVKVLVDNNLYVQAGAVLVEIDTRDYKVVHDRARADLAEALANLTVSRTEVPITSTTTAGQLSSAEAGAGEAAAKVATAGKEVDSAQARLGAAQARVREVQANSDRAARDLERMKVLVAKEEISRQQFDQAVATAAAMGAMVDTARANADAAQRQVTQARARVSMAEAQQAATRSAPQEIAGQRATLTGGDVLVELEAKGPGVADGPHASNGPVEMPVVWTKMYGKGRVFYCSLGHQADGLVVHNVVVAVIHHSAVPVFRVIL